MTETPVLGDSSVAMWRAALLTILFALTPLLAGSMQPPRSMRVVRMIVTAYCPCKKCCGEYADGITASGEPITHNRGRFVAADTKHFPLGTILHVPGYADDFPVPVLDRGGSIKGDRLDVFFPTHEAALQWGKRSLRVEVWDAE